MMGMSFLFLKLADELGCSLQPAVSFQPCHFGMDI